MFIKRQLVALFYASRVYTHVYTHNCFSDPMLSCDSFYYILDSLACVDQASPKWLEYRFHAGIFALFIFTLFQLKNIQL